MKKAISIFLIIICLCAVSIASMLLVMQTKHGTTLVSKALDYFQLPIAIKQVNYQYPNHLQLLDVTLQPDSDNALPIGMIEVWISDSKLHNQKFSIDSLLIQGISLQDGQNQLQAIQDWLQKEDISQYVYLHQLALSQLDYSDGEYVARDINVQINQPNWRSNEQLIPFGTIQLTATQAYWQSQAFDNLLLNLEYREEDSTIYGASFDWQGAHITGQAEQFAHGWSLINVTIEKLNTSLEQIKDKSAELYQLVQHQVTHINSLDIVRSQIELQGAKLDNLNLSIEDIDLTKSTWQQQGYLSLSADNAQIANYTLIEPSFRLHFSKDAITIDDFSAEFYQGDIYLNGQITPQTLHLEQLSVSGVKATLDQDLEALLLNHQQLKNILVDKLDIENSQLIQIAHKPYWQVSGFNSSGQDMELKRNNQWGMWQGKVNASANSLSFDNLIGTQAIVEMSSQDGLWRLDRAFIPLERGYIEAFGEMQFGVLSQPWRLALAADGAPIDVLNYYLDAPYIIEGTAEVDLNLRGLAGDKLMLAHSLSGQLWSELRDVNLFMNEAEYPLSMDALDWQFSRGIGKHEPVNIYLSDKPDKVIGHFDGQLDLLEDEKRSIVLSIELEGEEVVVEKQF